MIIDNNHSREILSHVKACMPEEACGLIGGKNDNASIVIPIENKYHSLVRFRMDEMELFKALSKLDQEGLDLIGIYHSHPNGPPHPSSTDLDELQFLDTVQIICSPDRNGEKILEDVWELFAFRIIGREYEAVPITII